MAAAFIGLTVKVLLSNGTAVTGLVADVDQNTQRLSLHDVFIQLPGESHPRSMPILGVAGGDIRDLQILPTPPPPPPAPVLAPPPPVPAPVVAAPVHTTQTQPSRPQQQPLQQQHQQQQASRPVSATASVPFHDPAIISFSHPGPPPPPAPFDEDELSEAVESARISKGYHTPQKQPYSQQYDQTLAESSAAESVNRGQQRRNRRSTQNNNSNNNHHNNHSHQYSHNNGNNHPQYNNNMSDYGSPRTSYQSASGKKSSRRYKEPVHEWATGDTEDFKDQDFDFQGNLGLFDKARVFADIKEADDTAPESLLVNLNRNPNRARAMEESPMLRKLKPTENVLDPAPKWSHGNSKQPRGGRSDDDDGDDDSWDSGEEEGTPGVGSVSVTSSSSNKKKVMSASASATALAAAATGTTKGNGGSGNSSVKGSNSRSIAIQTLSGVPCPTVSSLQMQEIEKLCSVEMGLTHEQMIENGGRGAAMMCLQALGGSRRIQPNNHNSAPVVVILAGNNRTGAYALCAARHLSNHGCQVMAFVTGSNQEGQVLNKVATQSRGFLAAGGELIHTIQGLPKLNAQPVDLIVDGLLGHQFTVRDLIEPLERETVCDLMDWANDNKAPVLSLDMPSGVHGTTGADMKSKFVIRPKWTLCLGAPKSGCRSRTTTGELFMTDLGIPRGWWKKVGVRGWGMPWGADFLVGLEYL